MSDLVLLTLIIATGYVTSGLAMSFFVVASGKAEYDLKPETEVGRLAAVGLTIFTGPAVLTGNAIRGRQTDAYPASWLAVAVGVSILWSYMLGLLVVSVAITLPSPF